MTLLQTSVRTTNGMKTFNTSLNANTDLFSSIGALRNASTQDIIDRFTRAWIENREQALRITFYNRDVLQGQGERNTARAIWSHLATHNPEIMINNLHKVPELGYWKDVLMFIGTPVENAALDLIAKGLNDKNGLCAKWMPRQGEIATKIRKHMKIASPKEFRKILVNLTKVVETQMCAKDWDNINYSHVPAKAGKVYRKAFRKHDEERYKSFLTKVEKGEAKINAKTLFPYEIVREYLSRYSGTVDQTLEMQWKSLPDFITDGNSFIPVCDVSGSMSNGSKPSPMEVCISLGLYLAERNKGPFKDAFITFSSTPTLQILKGDTLKDRVRYLQAANWEMGTNIEKVFNLILKTAVNNKLAQEDLPQTILIMSDMQFNACTKSSDASAFEMINRKFNECGYQTPQLVFWNLNASSGQQSPVGYNQQGVAMVSGFSPSIMTQLLSGGNMTPEKIMLDTIMNPRYDVVL